MNKFLIMPSTNNQGELCSYSQSKHYSDKKSNSIPVQMEAKAPNVMTLGPTKEIRSD